ncbi:unnamed protein product [Blepharisma stoltei]|uniref:RING-type domain-containing protein n=1 Tax=Blepharisma stoltei TaxID=1481888 RepID=A0AAU9JQE8_9CILI|nr:unnamed protein product [Blepharisma stoltei]
MAEEEKTSWWNRSIRSINNFARRSADSISDAARTGFNNTARAFDYIGDRVMNNGKCHMCKKEADINIPCGHELCSKCLKFYLESFGKSISELESVHCYICSEPIPLEFLKNNFTELEESNPDRQTDSQLPNQQRANIEDI